MPKKQYEMFPKGGGEPLPMSPIIAPYMPKTSMAKAYVKVLEKELVEEHNNLPKWTGAQRAEIKKKLCNWRNKANGLDEHFEKHGAGFNRPFNADPVGPSDYIAAVWRRRAQQKGIYVTATQHKARIIKPGDAERREIRRLRKKYGTKTIDPPKD